MKKLLKRVIVLCFSSVIAATPGVAEERATAHKDLDLRGSDCILIRTIRDYTPLDDRTLLISGAARRSYFVQLQRPVFGMRSSFRLGFSSRDGSLCPYGGDAIVFEGAGGESVGIRHITRLTKDQAEEILIRYGKKEPPEAPAPDPSAVEGAKVEELG